MQSIARIEVIDMNRVLANPKLLSQIKKLTLKPCYDGFASGMNVELIMFERLALERRVNASAIVAYLGSEMIGWALCTREASDFVFNTNQSFVGQGILFEVYVDPSYRQMGIGSALFRKASETFSDEKLFVCPWDTVSDSFYSKHKNLPHEII